LIERGLPPDWCGNAGVVVQDWRIDMVVLLALLLVLLFFGLGFALHLLWIVAVVLLVFWIVGFAIGRGEGAGSRHFYRW
jgi:hypothetical protein